MSKKEQATLVAFFNSLGLARRITAFDQLYDGKALTEVMSKIDGTHFKSPPSRSAGPSRTEENWVLRMNTLKRLYRLLLSYPLPSPHPASLSLSTLPEPPFSTIAQSPTNALAISGLVQISRICLSIAVWSRGNESVIAKIQELGEAHMTEIMRSIQEVMDTLPEQQERSPQNSPAKPQQRDISPPPTGLRAERDKLIQENDELRTKCEQMISQIAEISSNLDEVTSERDKAGARLQRETSALAGLKSSLSATSDIDALRADLAKAEENLARTEADLEKQLAIAGDLTKQVEEFRAKAAETSKLKDQLDEYRHAADKLQRSENVIEKYKKKLEDSAGLRRELRSLEEENAALVNTNATLEADLKKAGGSKALADSYRAEVAALEEKANTQATQIAELTVHLEHTRADLDNRTQAHERDLEELQLCQEKVRELQLEAGSEMKRSASKAVLLDDGGNVSLGDELATEDVDDAPETRTTLKLRIRTLQRDLADAKAGLKGDDQIVALETLLADVSRARDRYQANYLEAHRNELRLQANLEQIRAGTTGDDSMILGALRQRLDQTSEPRDELPKSKEETALQRDDLAKKLSSAEVDSNSFDKDQSQQLAAPRDPVARDTKDLEIQVATLKQEVYSLKEKDRVHLEEVNKLLLEEFDLQSSGINQRERASSRERELDAIRVSLSASGIDPGKQDKLLELHSENKDLASEVKTLSDKLAKAKDFIRNQDALFRADHANSGGTRSGEGQQNLESQIAKLNEILLMTRQAAAARDQQYKLEQQLMLSAWHELGSRTVRDHIIQAGMRRPIPRPVATSWLGRQRKQQEEAIFSR